MPIRTLLRCLLPAVAAALAAWLAGGAFPARAEVFHSRESALRLAFPEAERVEPVDVILTPGQAREVQRLSGVKPDSRLVTAWVGYAGPDGTAPLGWAFLDTHPVRTLPETLMLVVSPEGRIAQARMLAFHEPPEYMPSEGWLGRLEGAPLDDELRLGHRVDGISGATLSARAATAASRRLLAVWRVAFAPRDPETGGPARAGLP